MTLEHVLAQRSKQSGSTKWTAQVYNINVNTCINARKSGKS